MIIQIWHARNSFFQDELYWPIKLSSFFSEHTWVFPHDSGDINSRESIKSIDLFIAEVTTPAIGLWIELGFASAYGKKILCLSKKWVKISSSLSRITKDFIEYNAKEELIEKIGNFLTVE